jgi:hypothetical protein
MRALRLAGHYGQAVDIELCAPCHGLWFDPVEPARLSGPGLLDLIGQMAQAHSLAHTAARPDMHCPHCRGALQRVHNQTRWGRSLQLECKNRHGSWQIFGQFLAEKGLLRPMSSADRARALARDGALHCLNCGGTIAQPESQCSWCGSVPALVDVARLAHALDPEAATAGHPVHGTASAKSALACAACGSAQPLEPDWQCVNCGATRAAPGLAEAHHKLSALAPALHAHALRPAPHVVAQRLAAQQPALQRQRERAAQMQAEADARLRQGGFWPEAEADAAPGGLPLQRWRWWAWGIFVLALLLIVWLD